MKKGVSLIVFVFGMQFLLSTLFIGCADPCGPFEQQRYQLKDLNAALRKIAGAKQYNGNSDHRFQVYELEPFANQLEARYDSLGIEVQNVLQQAMKEVSDPFRFSFGYSTALACSPPSPSYDRIEEIEVISNNDYNGRYRKGENLVEMMQVRYSYGSEFVTDGLEAAEYIAAGNILDEGRLFFTFKESPDESRVHDLTIRYILESGEVHETSIENIFIRK